MMIFLAKAWSSITSKFGAILAGVSFGAILIILIFRAGGKAARDHINSKTAEKIIKTIKKVKQNEKDTRNMSDDDKRKFLLGDD